MRVYDCPALIVLSMTGLLSAQTGTFTGEVIYADVGGDGPNSAQLEFSVRPGTGPARTFAVFAFPSTEPQVFTAMAGMVTAALAQPGIVVTVTYLSTAGQTDRALGVALIKASGSPGPACNAHQLKNSGIPQLFSIAPSHGVLANNFRMRVEPNCRIVFEYDASSQEAGRWFPERQGESSINDYAPLLTVAILDSTGKVLARTSGRIPTRGEKGAELRAGVEHCDATNPTPHLSRLDFTKAMAVDAAQFMILKLVPQSGEITGQACR